MKYTKRAPCENCPFRTDIPPFLTAARGREIADSLQSGQEFACHKTIVYRQTEKADGSHEVADGSNAAFCAGALICMESDSSGPNQMMRICERLGLYDHKKLDMKAKVFKSLRAFVKAQALGRKKR